ncbi:uncharacterized protein BDZ99DRAFT_558079 [Mytilinidion resinicola]|uniref:Uncharacterized protein n=1 Tax=Mytilinidion resinicola TaxID=574789 RepID=A0A6A6YW67_9PEZI|nr:uncharacterized protein BDZ99DRAFT_558079 [Mytilinidion resinicola]KAF2812234.1 hypothetical protein BDZ99DRAFT_558079 [Mytilinidion resinicola]
MRLHHKRQLLPLRHPQPSAIGPGAIGSKDTRSNAPLRAMSSPQDFNAPLTSDPLPIGLGLTGNDQYNDEFGSYRDKVSMVEDAKKIREGLMPFAPPGVNALAFRLPEATPNPQPGASLYPSANVSTFSCVTAKNLFRPGARLYPQSGSQYAAFEHQVPRNYPARTAGYMFANWIGQIEGGLSIQRVAILGLVLLRPLVSAMVPDSLASNSGARQDSGCSTTT